MDRPTSMTTGTAAARRPPLRRSSVLARGLVLTAAWLWAGGVAVFCLTYHPPGQSGTPWLTIGGRTYRTGPPVLTFYRQDPVGARIVAVALGTCLAVGTVDLAVRAVRRSTVPGVGSILVGGLVVLFSLFGLVIGLLGIGTVGLLVLASAWPLRATGGAGDRGALPGAPPGWYPDPGGLGDLRYRDGTAWSPHRVPMDRSPVGPR